MYLTEYRKYTNVFIIDCLFLVVVWLVVSLLCLWRANYRPIDLDKQESKLWQCRCQGRIYENTFVLTLLWRLCDDLPFITDSRSLESLEIPFWDSSKAWGAYFPRLLSSGLQESRLMEFELFLLEMLQDGSFCNFCLMAWCAQLIKTMGKMNWNLEIRIWIQ